MTAFSAGTARRPVLRIVQWISCVAPATQVSFGRSVGSEFRVRGTTPPSVPPHRGEGGGVARSVGSWVHRGERR